MSYTFKNWSFNDVYDFYIEFNRIESYNEYCRNWLNDYYNIDNKIYFTSKTNWTMNDIVDLQDYNRVKRNINAILNAIESDNLRLTTSEQVNQVFNVDKANEMEIRLKEYLSYLGQLQFVYNITGLTTTGNNLKLGGVS